MHYLGKHKKVARKTIRRVQAERRLKLVAYALSMRTQDQCVILTASQGIEVFCKLTEIDEKSKLSLVSMAKLY